MTVQEYVIENDAEIFFSVHVSTPGMATTKVAFTYVSGDSEEKARSSDGAGAIHRTLLGKASELAGGLIEISTDILLDKLPPTVWPLCFDTLEIEYKLEGGKAGQKHIFKAKELDKEQSDSGKTICVEKYIQLNKRP